jgi:hypothetical protein
MAQHRFGGGKKISSSASNWLTADEVSPSRSAAAPILCKSTMARNASN